MKPSSRRRWPLCAALSLLVVVGLEVLGFRILGSVADALATSPGPWMVILGLAGFLHGRRLERHVHLNELDRAARPGPRPNAYTDLPV
jgi:hypothetical protein